MRMPKAWLLAFIMLMLFFFHEQRVAAQFTRSFANMLWFNYNQQVELSAKCQLLNDVQIRTRNWADEWSQFALRSGLQLRLNSQFAFTAGFAWFSTVRHSAKGMIIPNEWRPWQEISFTSAAGKFTLIQRLRSEQRFLERVVDEKKSGNYDFRLRQRYRIEMSVPIYRHTGIAAGNEVMLNLNHLSDSLSFDQNRLFITISQYLSSNLSVQFQFIRLYQRQAAVGNNDLQNVWRFSIHHQLAKSAH